MSKEKTPALRTQLRTASNVNVSERTIRHRLHVANLCSRRLAVRPCLTRANRAACLALSLPQESIRHKIVNCLVLSVLYVALKRGISSKIRTLSCFIWLKSVLLNLLYVFGVSSAALSSPADSYPSEFQRYHTTSQSFRSMHQPQTMKTKRKNSSTSSLLVS